MKYYFDDEDEKREFHGMVVHVRTTSNSNHFNITIDDKEIEITVFDGFFENMVTDHNDVKCIGIIVGHYKFKADYYFHGRGITMYDDDRQIYILGVGESHSFDISHENVILTKKVVKAFIKDKTIGRKKVVNYKEINGE